MDLLMVIMGLVMMMMVVVNKMKIRFERMIGDLIVKDLIVLVLVTIVILLHHRHSKMDLAMITTKSQASNTQTFLHPLHLDPIRTRIQVQRKPKPKAQSKQQSNPQPNPKKMKTTTTFTTHPHSPPTTKDSASPADAQ